MELRHLRYFVAVAKERNFTRAAEMLHMAQPPLSRQIMQLEEEIDARLIDRDTRPLRLTEAGVIFFEQAERVLADMEQLRSTMQQLGKNSRQRFAIGFVASTLYGHLPEAIRQFRRDDSNLEVTLVEMSTVKQIQALKEGRIDVGFGRLRFEDPGIRRIVLAEERLVAVVPSGHALPLHGGQVQIADLASQNLVVYPRPERPSYADQVLSCFHDEGLSPARIIEAGELQTAIGLVAAHAGIAIVPKSVEQLRRGDVTYVPIRDSVARSPILMIHRVGDISSELERLTQISCKLHEGG